MSVKIKQEVTNTFTFNYFIDTDMDVSECNVYRYLSDDFDDYVPENNKMRLIRAYYENNDIDKFIYMTNCRKLLPTKYTKGNPDKYDVTVEFEDRLTLKMNKDWSTVENPEDILGNYGAGNFRLIRS